MNPEKITEPIIRTLLILALSIMARCAPDLAQGGSEAGNAKVIGAVVFKSGEPASGTVVRCIDPEYNPVGDSPLADSMIDTADASGTYRFPAPPGGTFTIEAVHPVRGSRLLIAGLKTSNGPLTVPASVLKPPGCVKFFLPDTLDTADASVFIKGTTMAFPLSKTVTDSSGRRIVLDSVPATIIPAIYYCKVNNPPGAAVISDTIVVPEGDTAEAGAFVFWVNYTAENSNLGANRVEKLFISRSGDLWCCPFSRGAARFDGKDWKRYDSTNSTLPGSVRDITQDASGTLWFATGKGVMAYNGSEWKVYDASGIGLPSDDVTALALENDSALWIGMHDGIARYDIFRDSLTVYDTATTTLPSHAIMDVTVNSDRNVWFGTAKGFAYYYNKTWNNSESKDSCIAVADKISSVWIGFSSCVLRFDGGQMLSYGAADSKILGARVRDIFSYAPDELLVGTDNGLTSFNYRRWTEYAGKRYAPIDKKRVSCVVKDAKGTVWVDTQENGIIGFGPAVK